MTKNRTNGDPLSPMANAFNGAKGTTHHHWHQWWSPLVTIGAISKATTVPLNGDITAGSPSKGKGSVGNNSDNGDNGKWTSIGDNGTIVSNVDNWHRFRRCFHWYHWQSIDTTVAKTPFCICANSITVTIVTIWRSWLWHRKLMAPMAIVIAAIGDGRSGEPFVPSKA